MQFYYYLPLFIFGLIMGSFLNALVWRMHRGRSMLGYSECPLCQHRLGAADLVPIFSFIFLKTRCRYCHGRISWQYPLVEIAAAVAFLLAGYRYTALVAVETESAWILGLLFLCALVTVLLGIFVFDWKYYLIPDSLVLTGIVLTVVYRLIFLRGYFLDGLWGALLLVGFFGFLYLVSGGRWLGLGDAKLGVFLGLLLGFKMSLVMLMIAYISGALVGVALVLSKKKTLKGILPFGAFLTFSTLIVLLWGNEILNWYLQDVINL